MKMNQVVLSRWKKRILRRGMVAGLLMLPLSACAIYPEPPPEQGYYGGACCYSYYEYPAYYPYYYGSSEDFDFREGGGYRHWR